MSPAVNIRPGESDEETIPATTKWTRTRELGKMRRARITVPRADADAVTLTEKTDDIELVGVDTLRLVDIESGGPTVTLVCFSYEWLANTVAPTNGGTARSGSDADLVADWISDVPQWTAGTITEQATGLSFVFNHAAPHEGLRRVEKNVPGELLFRDTGTVDYVDRVGRDKPGTITLSSANQNIEDEITITKRGRELDGTHIRVLGAHEGEAQFFANLVPSDDNATYDNRVNYSTSRWSAGDTRDWDRFVNKDVTDQATIEAEAAELGTEIVERHIEATATTTVALNVGDTVQVRKPDAGLDRSMRVHRVKEVAEGGTVTRELLLSTRTIVRSDDSEDLRDIQRLNSGYQGSSVVVQGGGSRQPVDATNNAEIPFFYPDLEFENKAELFVRGLNYRHYSVPNEHAHDVTHPSHAHDVTHPSHNHEISTTTPSGAGDIDNVDPIDKSQTLDSGQVFKDTFSLPTISGDGAFAYVYLTVQMGGPDDNSSGDVGAGDVRIRNTTSNTNLQPFDGFDTSYSRSDVRTYQVSEAGNVEGDTIEIRFDAGGDNNITYRFSYGGISYGEHTHNVSDTSTTALGTSETSTSALGTTETSSTAAGATAGIKETTDTPSSVDVNVNGTTVATDIGTGTFQTTVDISGNLTKNAWNLIELTSDDLGHISGTLSIRGYDQIGKK
jgi:hypothetical protein